MAWQQGPYGTDNATITAGQTTTTVLIGNPSEVGLQVPTLTTPTTVTLKVGSASDGSDAKGIVDQGGTAKLALASGSGNVAISSLDLAAILGYKYLTIVIGATQAADKVFVLDRKSVSVSR